MLLYMDATTVKYHPDGQSFLWNIHLTCKGESTNSLEYVSQHKLMEGEKKQLDLFHTHTHAFQQIT